MASPVAVLKSRWFLTLIGVVLLCLLLWFAGPYFAFADARPLATTAGRLVAILIVVLAWAFIWQWKAWQAARATRELGQAAGAGAAAPAGPGAGRAGDARGAVGGADAQLRGKFEEAFAALRKSGKNAQGLLELPWYIIIGPPGCGKTTVLSNSGLEFPLADRFGKAAVRGVGGTRSCDWWFTSEAILLDTAGRYTTQDSDESADRAGWVEFLTLLKKHRRRRPINGVLLAFSIADLAAFSDEERERHVQAIRARLAELYQRLAVQLPVYVLFTKADLVAGFTEYFDDLDKKDREQVWGATFPWDVSRAGKAHERLAVELDDLVARLAARVPDRLQVERDAGRRAAVFGFPQQLAGLKTPLVGFVRDVFGGAALDERVWLRGVYLTSGTQEGTPIDRMLGALAKTFRLGVQPVAAAPGRGKAYFIERLLREVVFREAGLAGSDRRAERRALALLAGGYLGLAGVTALLVIALLVSYRANRQYLAEVASAAAALADTPSPGGNSTLEAALPSLDAVRHVVDTAGRYRGGVPLRMRFGLYQGDAMWGTAEDAYLRELNASLGPAAARLLAERVAAAGAEPDKLYEYLKAYLMLAEPKKYLQPAQIQLIADAEWARTFAAAPETAQRIATHFDALTDQPERVQPATVNADLVERARASLQQASLPLLVFSSVRLSYADDKRALHLERDLGVNAALMVRRSGKPLSEPFPALYTRAVFDDFNNTRKYELVGDFLKDSWVLGDQGPSLKQSPQLAADVVQLYEAQYIRAWDALLGDITVKAPRDTAEAAATLGALASPTSPLKRLLIITDANTNLLKPPPAGSPQATANAKLAQATGTLNKMLGVPQGPKPGSAVTVHFAPVNALVAGAPGPAPIDQLLGLMTQAQQQLQSATGLGGQPGSPAVLAGIQNALGALKTATAQLPPVAGGLVGGLTGQSQSVAMGVAHSDLQNRYETQVISQCRELLGTRYPFDRASPNDVTLEDFARVFATGGIYDAFFQANLAPLVDTSRPTWRWKEGAESIGGSAAMLRQFQEAERLRQVFFKPGGQTPEVHFNVSLTSDDLDALVDSFRLEIDGQSPLEYRHGPPKAVSMSWPGGAAGHAIAFFQQRSGAHAQLESQGPWALFRLLDQASVQPLSDTRLAVTFKGGGSQARVIFEAASIRNPFVHQEVTRFHCS
jgi:type VI secretion system protein ImpL